VTDDAADRLSRLTQLRSLTLELTAVSEAGFVRLHKALPQASISIGANDAMLGRAVGGRSVIVRKGLLLTATAYWAMPLPGTLKRLHARGNYRTGHRQGDTVVVGAKTVTDAGLQARSGLTAMEELDLRDSGVTDAGLPALLTLTNLKRLDLRGTAVTDAGRETLAKSLPGCEILR
jgi:hypothetical protein